MSALVRTYPALSLLVLAMLFGVAPLVAVHLPELATALGERIMRRPMEQLHPL